MQQQQGSGNGGKGNQGRARDWAFRVGDGKTSCKAMLQTAAWTMQELQSSVRALGRECELLQPKAGLLRDKSISIPLQ